MLRSQVAIVAVAALLAPSTHSVRLHGRDINEPLLEYYDYIVVGCGISGLVVTNRISEDPSRTVLCIEAGDADHYEAIIQDPVYVGADIGGIYDWDLVTVPQTQLDGNTRPMPQGKVLGGGSILNAMCWNRGGADDYDAWEALGNPGWNWEGMLPYFMRSETYTPVFSEDIAHEYSINFNPAVHGTSGPVQVSYPRYFYPQSTNLFAAMNLLGLPTQFDPNDGTSAGPAFVPTDLDPNNQTRSDARRTYFDPYVGRSNFHVITGQHVTRLLIDGVGGNSAADNPTAGGNPGGNGPSTGNNEGFGFGPQGRTPPLVGRTSSRFARRQSPGTASLRISGVEFASNANSTRQTVFATREVIVAAGSLHSAQLLQLSGIGPASLLSQFGIPLAIDLPGVGNNLQDHPLVGTFYPYNNASYPSPTELTTNATYNVEAEQEYETDKTGPWTAGSPNALAFNPLPLISNNSETILAGAANQDPTEYLPSGLDPTIIAGFTAQKASLARRLGQKNVAAYEIINNNAGSLTVSVLHPLSRGTCFINTPNPFEPPVIDPRWLTNPVDRQVLVEALRFNRQILATPPMQELQPAQFVPPADADEDAINQVINSGVRTEFHPSGTLAMMPLELGGVVNSHLTVYGTQNLRVVDAGIFPLVPAAHLQAVVYGVAEKAADIIKSDNLPAILPNNSTNSTNSSMSLASASASSRIVPSANTSAILFPNITATIVPSAARTLSLVSSLSGLLSFTINPATIAMSSSPLPALPASLQSSSKVGPASSVVSILSSLSSVVANSAFNPPPDATTLPLSLSPSETVIVVTSALPSRLPGLLSSIDASLPTSKSPPEATTRPISSKAALSSIAPLLGPAELSTSVVGALSSAGLPSDAVASVVPVILGSPTQGASSATASSSTSKEEQQEDQAAIDALIQYLLKFFHLD